MKVFVFCAAAMLILLAAPMLSFAEGGEHGEQAGHGEHHFDWMQFLGKTFNSVVLFGGLFLLLRKPLVNLLAQKSLDIKNDIVQREELVKTTSTQLDDIKKRLEVIEEEVKGMKANAEKSGNDEKKRIEELGKKEEERILAMTEQEIDNKVESSIRNLKERIADMTIEHFKKDIKTQLDKKTHEKLIEKNIKIISGETIERE